MRGVPSRPVLRRLSVVVALAACAWALGAGSAHAQSGSYWCAGHPGLKTCIVSVTYDGNPLAADDPNFDVFAIPASGSGAKIVLWAVQAVPPADDLTAAAGKTFSVTINTN